MAPKTEQARQRVTAMRTQQARRDRRLKITIFGIGGVILAALIAVSALGISKDGAEKARLPEAISGQGTGQPPWPVPADPVKGARAAGLSVQPMEGTAKHFHAHLDLIVNGKPVPVPANLGIEPSGSAMSELHTHDETGILHIEAPTASKRYTLGQLFSEWNVRLNDKSIGGLTADETHVLRAYMDGKLTQGNPADIELAAHREIALVYGPANQKVDVPARYDFPPGV
jgi:hypothetical protein